MAVSINDSVSGATLAIDTNTRAAKATLRPNDIGALGSYSISQTTGAEAAGAAANSPIWSCRYASTTAVAVVRQVFISMGNTATAFTAGVVQWQLFILRAYTVADTGGGTATITGNNNKMRTSFATTGFTEFRIGSTGVLTAGTQTADSQAIGSVTTGVPATAGSAILTRVPLLAAGQDQSNYPVILAANEGLVLRTTVPATGTWTATVDMVWDEMAAY